MGSSPSKRKSKTGVSQTSSQSVCVSNYGTTLITDPGFVQSSTQSHPGKSASQQARPSITEETGGRHLQEHHSSNIVAPSSQLGLVAPLQIPLTKVQESVEVATAQKNLIQTGEQYDHMQNGDEALAYLSWLEKRVQQLEEDRVSERIEKLCKHLQSSKSRPSMGPVASSTSSHPFRGPRRVGVVFSERFPSIPSSSQLFQQLQEALLVRASTSRGSLQFYRFPSYQEALASHSGIDSVLYVCFTTGVRYHHDLPPDLVTDTQHRKVFLLSLFTGCMEKSSATWSAELTPFVYDIFVDEEKGMSFPTVDPHETDRLVENNTILNSLFTMINN